MVVCYVLFVGCHEAFVDVLLFVVFVGFIRGLVGVFSPFVRFVGGGIFLDTTCTP